MVAGYREICWDNILYLQPARLPAMHQIRDNWQQLCPFHRSLQRKAVFLVSFFILNCVYKILPLNNSDSSRQSDWSESMYLYLKQIMQCQEAAVWLLLSDAKDYRGSDSVGDRSWKLNRSFEHLCPLHYQQPLDYLPNAVRSVHTGQHNKLRYADCRAGRRHLIVH